MCIAILWLLKSDANSRNGGSFILGRRCNVVQMHCQNNTTSQCNLRSQWLKQEAFSGLLPSLQACSPVSLVCLHSRLCTLVARLFWSSLSSFLFLGFLQLRQIHWLGSALHVLSNSAGRSPREVKKPWSNYTQVWYWKIITFAILYWPSQSKVYLCLTGRTQ